MTFRSIKILFISAVPSLRTLHELVSMHIEAFIGYERLLEQVI